MASAEPSSPGGRDLRQGERPRCGLERRAHERVGVATRQQPQTGEGGLAPAVPRRRRVEHDAAGDRGLGSGGADDHAIASRRGDELTQAQLGEARRAGRQRARLEQRDACVDARRAREHLHERAVRDPRPVGQRP